MALKIYYKEDIEYAIMGDVILVLSLYAANGARNTEHVIGLLDLARAWACHFGLNWVSILDQCKERLEAGPQTLLESALKQAALESTPRPILESVTDGSR